MGQKLLCIKIVHFHFIQPALAFGMEIFKKC
uniref:Uncharacterized protein n=1 Tax=Anguilla anguilla TaxID=7936 RepID=A0A0E9RSN4_ANGAN